jgi:hypothetical protein
MAKRQTSSAKRANSNTQQRKRETHAQRRAGEEKRSRVREMARKIAGAIRTRREASAQERQLFEYFEKVMRIVSSDDISLECESVEDIAQSLRLAADMLEEKPMDGRSLSWHDGRVIAAFLGAARRMWSDPRRRSLCFEDEILRITSAQPTFSEFLEVYREENPGVEVEDSSLRRSLRRLGALTLPEKRGRKPKEK